MDLTSEGSMVTCILDRGTIKRFSLDDAQPLSNLRWLALLTSEGSMVVLSQPPNVRWLPIFNLRRFGGWPCNKYPLVNQV